MPYEVEVKFRIRNISVLQKRISELGGSFGEPAEEIDQFYQHPGRDFAKTDEGLRIRTRIQGDHRECFITYKGPKIDSQTKTRKEIEIPLDCGEVGNWDKLLKSLGFQPSGEVRKIRRNCTVSYRRRTFEISLDFLPNLNPGKKRCFFLEIETLANRKDVGQTREILLDFAKTLPLGENIRKGYLEMVLQAEEKLQ